MSKGGARRGLLRTVDVAFRTAPLAKAVVGRAFVPFTSYRSETMILRVLRSVGSKEHMHLERLKF